MKWTRVDLKQIKPHFPQMLDLDVTGSEFNSVTIRCPEGIFRIARESYSVGIQKMETPVKIIFTVTAKKDEIKMDERFDDMSERDKRADQFRRLGLEVEIGEVELPLEPIDGQLRLGSEL